MHKRVLFVSLLIAAAATAQAAEVPVVSSGGVTLQECYQKALHVSETIPISEEAIRQVETQYREALAGVLPNVSWLWTYQIQDVPNAVDSSSSSVQNTLTRRTTPLSYVELQQPIFHGFREFNAMAGLKSGRARAQFQKEQAAQSLLSDISSVFYVAYSIQ